MSVFKPRLDFSLLGIDSQLLRPVSINYPDLNRVCAVPLFRVCGVITGRTCLKLLFSRWQARPKSWLVPPFAQAGAHSQHLAFRWHVAATGLAELKWVMVKVLLTKEEQLQIPRTQRANTLYSMENLASRPVQKQI